MESNNFERQWKDAFQGAEALPSGSVWTNVELDLEKAAGRKMKQRILFYKLMAAASLIFALGLAGVYYVERFSIIDSMANNGADNLSPDQIVKSQSSQSTDRFEDSGSEESDGSSQSELNQEVKQTRSDLKKPFEPTYQTTQSESPFLFMDDHESKSAKSKIVSSDEIGSIKNSNDLRYPGLIAQDYPFSKSASNLTALSVKKPAFPKPQSNADPGMVLLAQLKDQESRFNEEHRKVESEKIWSSLGFGAGTFNPNSPQSSTVRNSLSSGNTSNVSNNPSPGSSYSVGLQVGGKLTERLVLQGGISYLTHNASYSSNLVSMESASMRAVLNDYAFSNSSSVATSPYGVSSNLQYISLPVQAGYILLDRKFAIQINGGIATDVFLQNTLTPDSDTIDPVSQGPGTDSPYRPVSFSGLAGTELSYRVADRYRIALNPGLRYALGSIYKSDYAFDVEPLTIDVALRFRYIFK